MKVNKISGISGDGYSQKNNGRDPLRKCDGSCHQYYRESEMCRLKDKWYCKSCSQNTETVKEFKRLME